jgi:hypothetical protein
MEVSLEMAKKNTETPEVEKTPNEEHVSLESAMEDLASIKQELADQVVELEELHSLSLEETTLKNAELAEVKVEMEALKAQLAEVIQQKNQYAKELKLIEDAKILNHRLSELEELKLLRNSEGGLREQAQKVTEMTNEQFESYKTELVDIFESIKLSYAEKSEINTPQIDAAQVAASICNDQPEQAASDEEVEDLVSRAIKNLKISKKAVVIEELAEEGEVDSSVVKEQASVKTELDLVKAFTGIYTFKNK